MYVHACMARVYSMAEMYVYTNVHGFGVQYDQGVQVLISMIEVHKYVRMYV